MTLADDIVTKEVNTPDTRESKNKALVLKAFDAGPESSYVAGANLTVDGGMNA
jgi:NAD(P)-dependent dehydrogenase (short-subunit alcohol dehydrogenase family)